MTGWPGAPGLPESSDGHLGGPGGPYRAHLFEGRLLDADVLAVEQVYQDLRQRLPAQVWGPGVIRGLWVEVPGLLPAPLAWPATGPLTGGHGAHLPLVLRRGLGLDGQGTPLALAEDLAVNLDELYRRWLEEPRALTEGSLGRRRLESAPLRLADSSRMPAGAYVLAARAVEARGDRDIHLGLSLGLLRLPYALPTATSSWGLRGAVAQAWQEAERSWRRSREPGFEDGDPTTGAVGERPGSTPLGLALLIVGADQSLLCCDPWIVRRELVAPQGARCAAGLGGQWDESATQASQAWFQQMLDESLQLRPPELGNLSLVSRGFASLPAVGFLPAPTGSGPLDATRLKEILSVARGLLGGTNALYTVEIAPDAGALQTLLARAQGADPILLRSVSGIGSPGQSLDVLLPGPVGRAVRETSADRIDWGDDAVSSLDPWGERGLRAYGLDHLVRREIELVRLIVLIRPGQERLGDRGAAEPEVLPQLAFVRHCVSLPLTVAVAPRVEPRPVETAHPTVRITTPETVETVTLVEPAELYVRTRASAEVGSTVTIRWQIDSALELSELKLVIGEIGSSAVESWNLAVDATSHPWTIPPGSYATGMGMHITVSLVDKKGRKSSCQSRGLMVTQPVEPVDTQPTPASAAFLSPSRSQLMWSEVGNGDWGYTAEIVRAGINYRVQWEVIAGDLVTEQTLGISDPGGSYSFDRTLSPADRHCDWTVPDQNFLDRGLTFNLALWAGPTRLYVTQLQGFRVQRASVADLTVEVLARGFLGAAVPEIYGDEPRDIYWKVSNATSALSFDLRLILPDGSSSVIATGIPGVETGDGLMYTWPAEAIAQLETGWNRRIQVTATESASGRTDSALSEPFITVKKMSVRFVEPWQEVKPWRSGYLWPIGWLAAGGRGAAEGLAPSYLCEYSLIRGASSGGGAILARASGEGLSAAEVFLQPGTLPNGAGTLALSRQVQALNIGRYLAVAHESQPDLLPEPTRSWGADPGSDDSLVTQLYDDLSIMFSDSANWAAVALARQVSYTVVPWCRPVDLGREDAFDPFSSRFCRDEGLAPLDMMEEGRSFVEILQHDPGLAGRMAEFWLRGAGAGQSLGSLLSGFIARLTALDAAQVADDVRLRLPTSPRDLVEQYANTSDGRQILQMIGPDAILRMLVACASPRTFELTSPSAWQVLQSYQQVRVAATLGAGWVRPELTLNVTVLAATGAPIHSESLDLSGLVSDQRVELLWPAGTSLQGVGASEGARVMIELICSDSDAYMHAREVTVFTDTIGV